MMAGKQPTETSKPPAPTCGSTKAAGAPEQRNPKDSADEIEVMSGGIREPPTHHRDQVKSFGYVCKDNHRQTSRAG